MNYYVVKCRDIRAMTQPYHYKVEFEGSLVKLTEKLFKDGLLVNESYEYGFVGVSTRIVTTIIAPSSIVSVRHADGFDSVQMHKGWVIETVNTKDK